MTYHQLDTPSLLINKDILTANIESMSLYAKKHGVALRPHTKAHNMPYIANLQCNYGAIGMTVANVSEAEVMAAQGLKDIFIANQIVGLQKIERILELSKNIKISMGVDSPFQIDAMNRVFAKSNQKANILIEIEVGENCSGIGDEANFFILLDAIKQAPHIELKGVYSHDGHTYNAQNLQICRELTLKAQQKTLDFAALCREEGFDIESVSIGSTPPFISNFEILEGITEIRPGTYALMDASQSNVVGTYHYCAVTVLATVISKPTLSRVILDVGAKGLTKEERIEGICSTEGKGVLLDFPNVYIKELFDEHAMIENEIFRNQVNIGDKVRIIPNHIGSVCNLYETASLLCGEKVYDTIPILGREKIH